jgi:adenosylcobinamide kinase / adenosylcobinamide-phosphate guanylyltransferase
MSGEVLLVLGGARSGKSRFAEEQAAATGLDKIYLATAQAWDEEMAARIAQHQADRAVDGWLTVEEPLGLPAAVMRESRAHRVVLVDCLTLWINNLLCAERDVGAASAAFMSALANARGPVALVSNEIGLGIVPDNPLARAFRDHAGRLHQMIAAKAERVVLMVAGLPMAVKGDPQYWMQDFSNDC